MAEGKFVSYLRVSTDKQGRSGLGARGTSPPVVTHGIPRRSHACSRGYRHTPRMRLHERSRENDDASQRFTVGRCGRGSCSLARKLRSGLCAHWHRGTVDPARVASSIGQKARAALRGFGSPFAPQIPRKFLLADFKIPGALRPMMIG
jgi:hypothetical protein